MPLDEILPELKNGLELLELLRSNINDFEEFILFRDKKGIAFKENVSAINDFNDVRSIIIAEQTRFDTGGSDSCRLEFTNKTPKSEATVTRSKYEDEKRNNNAYTYVGIRSAAMGDFFQELTDGETVFDQGDKQPIKIITKAFLASLALALGLSDEVQTSTGIRLDTMFVDEGFGSLDSEALSKAYATLAGLTEGNRLVGIISHVAELKERIDKQIVVTKLKTGGSTAQIIV